MPLQQYQEDGRIVMGLRRGATSFTTSSGVAVVELTSRALQSLQVCSLCHWWCRRVFVIGGMCVCVEGYLSLVVVCVCVFV